MDRRRKSKKGLVALLVACFMFLVFNHVSYNVKGFGRIEFPFVDLSAVQSGRYPKGFDMEIDINDWKYQLVNMKNPISEDYYVELTEVRNGYQFDARAADALEQMLDAGISQGMDLLLVSAYRSYDYQNELYENKTQRLINQGYNQEDALDMAATAVARPGESEHNIGLAVDIVSGSYPILDDEFENTPEAKWLREHCAEYGFILRYERGKQPITGIIYEPWHFRYVGQQAARYIMDSGLCLEEFLEMFY